MGFPGAGCYVLSLQRAIMTSMSGLFKILTHLYIFRSVQLAIALGRGWSKFTGEPPTAHKKSLANQAALFIVAPIAVFVHERAHAPNFTTASSGVRLCGAPRILHGTRAVMRRSKLFSWRSGAVIWSR